MKNKILIYLFVFVVFLSLLTTNVEADYCEETASAIWNVGSASIAPSEVDPSEPVSITIPITNNAQNTDYTCTISAQSKSVSKQVQTGRTEELTLQINAPSYETTTQKTETVNIHVECSGTWDRPWPLCDYHVYSDLTRSASYKWPTQASLQELQKISQALVEWESAKNLITQVKSSISKAKTSIQKAKTLNIGIASAENYLTTAESKLAEAENLNTVAYNLAESGGDINVATQKFKDAQNSATQARTNAESAYSSAQSLIDQYEAKKVAEQKAYEEAKNKAENSVSDAKSAVDRANEMVKKAEDIISDADVLGLDTAQAKANLDTGKAKADLANNYYNEGKSALDVKNFDSAKSKASSAISYANEGENYATSAYNSLAGEVQRLGAVAKSLISANEEVRKMNDVYTKMDYIIKSAEKWGVILTDAKGTVSTAKTDIDSAEDLMSQAQHRREAGVFEESANLAIQARDAAAKATNRLDTITQSISTQTQEALEKAYIGMEAEIKNTETEVDKGEQTYGADATQIIAAKTSLSSSKTKLNEAKNAIENVKTAVGLENLLTEANTAFKKLEAVQEDLNTSLEKVGSAQRIRIIKIASIGAAVAAAAGGGFLYYKKRKKKVNKKEEHEEKKEEPKKEEKKKGKHCTECGAELEGKEKFCSGCGKRV